METQPLPLPPELAQALAENGGAPLVFEDQATHDIYFLVEKPVEIALDDDYIRSEVAKGMADVEAGRVEPWDVEALLAEAHRRHADRHK